MLPLVLTIAVLAAAPRGLPAAHSSELITGVDKRLPKWLTGEGDRTALLATPKEFEAFFLSLGVKPADAKGMVAAAVQEQAEKAELQQFVPTKVLIEYADRAATLNFFDEGGRRCEVPLFSVGTEAAPRYVLLSGPRTDSRTIEAVLEGGRQTKAMLVFAEKKGGTWVTGSMPMPPPPDCTAVLKTALKAIYRAEKSYFAEIDGYSNSLAKIGVDLKALGVTSAKVSVKGAAPEQTFIIQVGLRDGVMRMDDKAEISVVSPCTQ